MNSVLKLFFLFVCFIFFWTLIQSLIFKFQGKLETESSKSNDYSNQIDTNVHEKKNMKFRKIFKNFETVNYFWVAPPRSLSNIPIIGQNLNKKSQKFYPKDLLKTYFKLLNSPTVACRKLYRAGGKLLCRTSQKYPIFDGHKNVCLDQELQTVGIKTTKGENCLVLSFGTHIDTSFDEIMSRANCEVHMFDFKKYQNYSAVDGKRIFFHEVGLSAKKINYFIPKENRTYVSDNLNNIILNLGLQNRVINILKIDIEGGEWDILEDLLNQRYLDLIMQIAVEVHPFIDESRDKKDDDELLESYLEILLDFEKKGFRRVRYCENTLSKNRVTDKEGTIYFPDGELLLVNSKWYQKSHRQFLKENGYNVYF
ncbi:UNVERIFIED_CONTAM: hypothetical protein RMT77_008310 [Armadillidium vulgare]